MKNLPDYDAHKPPRYRHNLGNLAKVTLMSSKVTDYDFSPRTHDNWKDRDFSLHLKPSIKFVTSSFKSVS